MTPLGRSGVHKTRIGYYRKKEAVQDQEFMEKLIRIKEGKVKEIFPS